LASERVFAEVEELAGTEPAGEFTLKGFVEADIGVQHRRYEATRLKRGSIVTAPARFDES
jgi:hypothetical protein